MHLCGAKRLTKPEWEKRMGESIGLTAEELLTTTRSVRKRLDLERPVSRESTLR